MTVIFQMSFLNQCPCINVSEMCLARAQRTTPASVQTKAWHRTYAKPSSESTIIQFTDEFMYPLRWRHNEYDDVLNHQRFDCLRNRLFRTRSKKTSKLRVTGLCEGNSPVTGEFPAQRASNAENFSILWRHHVTRPHWVTILWPAQTWLPMENEIFSDVLMGAMASQITSLTVVSSSVYSGADQRKL